MGVPQATDMQGFEVLPAPSAWRRQLAAIFVIHPHSASSVIRSLSDAWMLQVSDACIDQQMGGVECRRRCPFFPALCPIPDAR